MKINHELWTTALTALTLTLSACSGATTGEDDDATADMGNDDDSVDSGPDVDEDIPSDEDYSAIVINEVAAAGDPEDWFEVLNTGTESVDLGGCTFTDDAGEPNKAAIAADTTLAPGAYLVLDISDETVGFKIGGDEELYLYTPEGVEIDGVDWEEGDSPENGSFARLPNGSGEFETTGALTRGAENMASEVEVDCGNGALDEGEECEGELFGDATCEAQGFASGDLSCSDECEIDTSMCVAKVASVFLNEITSAGDDQIELYNAGDDAALIEGWFVADDGYPEDMESRYVFPAGAMIDPGAFLVLTKDVEHEFGVGKDDTITLYDADAAIVDQIALPEDAAEISYCRSEDGAGAWMTCSAASFGTANTP